MLNLIFSGQLKAMPPKLVSDEGDNVVIRPLIYCAEDDLVAFAAEERFPIIPCDLCGSQVTTSGSGKAVSRLLADARREVLPGARRNMLAALGNDPAEPPVRQGALGQAGARGRPGGRGRGDAGARRRASATRPPAPGARTPSPRSALAPPHGV